MSEDKDKKRVNPLYTVAYAVLLRERMAADSTYTMAKLNAELTAVANEAASAAKGAR